MRECAKRWTIFATLIKAHIASPVGSDFSFGLRFNNHRFADRDDKDAHRTRQLTFFSEIWPTSESRWCSYHRRVRRPLPNIPRLRDRFRPATPAKPLLLGCPRISPDWELAALQALIKPQKRGPILHRAAEQVMPRDWRHIVETTSESLRETICFALDLHWPTCGDYWFAAQVDPAETALARATAVLLSQRLPGIWITAGKLFVRDGQFFRRQFGTKLILVPAANVHLPKELRAAIRRLRKGDKDIY